MLNSKVYSDIRGKLMNRMMKSKRFSFPKPTLLILSTGDHQVLSLQSRIKVSVDPAGHSHAQAPSKVSIRLLLEILSPSQSSNSLTALEPVTVVMVAIQYLLYNMLNKTQSKRSLTTHTCLDNKPVNMTKQRALYKLK